MDHIDFDRLKTGEVNLGVCTSTIVPFDADNPRPRSWLSNSTEASLSAQTVVQPLEATSYALIPSPSQRPIHRPPGQSCHRQTDIRPRSNLLLPFWLSSRHAGRRRHSPLQPSDVQVRSVQKFQPYQSIDPLESSQSAGKHPSVHTAAAIFQRLCYENKDALSAGIIVAGWDKENGPSVFNIPLGGGLFRQPWAIGGTRSSVMFLTKSTHVLTGSGSTYVYGYCDATYREGWGRDETINFVKNSVFFPSFSALVLFTESKISIGAGNVARWFLGWCYPHVCHHRRQGGKALCTRERTAQVLGGS